MKPSEGLHSSEELPRLLLDFAMEGIYGVGLDGNTTFVNRACIQLLGYDDKNQLLDKNMHSLVHHTRADGTPYPDKECLIYRCFRVGGKACYVDNDVFWRQDGSSFPVEYRANPLIRDDEIVGAIVTFNDLTERKNAEIALTESETKYRLIVETAHEGIWLLDADHTITFANRRMAEMLGYTREELIGRKSLEFLDNDGRKEAERRIKSRRTGVAQQYDTRFLHRDGSDVWVSVSAAPVTDEGGSFVGALLMVSDVTARRKLGEQLRQSQKMQAVGQLTGGIAHDFNNLLTIIIGNLQLLEEAVKENEVFLTPLHAALDAGFRGAQLTSRLLAFSRKQQLTPKVIDINELITELEPLLHRTLGEDISIKTKLAGDLWLTRVDPGQLENSLINLAVNAKDAMPNGGKLTIETSNTFLDEDYARHHAEVLPGEYVQLTVNDNGTGIPKDVVERVFEPFFSTKETGKGTGLGLSMVYGFVKQSVGHVTIYSEEGHGTTITIYLPKSHSDAEKTSATSTMLKRIPSGNETILLVEDEAGVRKIAVALLTGLGYRVLEADAGQEALALLEQHDDIDLLFTDMVMPGGMTGADLARQARERKPTLKVLYTTGYTDTAIFENGLSPHGSDVLNKPYQKRELAQKVRDILDQG